MKEYVLVVVGKNPTQLTESEKIAKTYLENVKANIDNVLPLPHLDPHGSAASRFSFTHDSTQSDSLRAGLVSLSEQHHFEFYLRPKEEFFRKYQLACFDMDSCILGNECIDEMAAVFGKGEQVSEITRRAMKEGMDFDTALRMRLELLKGMTREQLQSVWKVLKLNPGAHRLIQLLKRLGVRVALLSGGFTFFAYEVAAALQIDEVYSNTLQFDSHGVFLGTVSEPIVNGQMKETILLRLADERKIPVTDIISMGDGANDRWMVARAGLGVAYHAKAILKAATPHHLNWSSLETLIYFLPFNEILQDTKHHLVFDESLSSLREKHSHQHNHYRSLHTLLHEKK